MTTTVQSVDPRTGQAVEAVAHDFSAGEVAARCEAAAAVAGELEAAGPRRRAQLLRVMADELEGDGEAIVALADRESALGTTRLGGELARSAFQLRMFADVLEDGGYLAVTVDHADPNAAPVPLPDLRRMLVPLGPVAVFGASNFPTGLQRAGRRRGERRWRVAARSWSRRTLRTRPPPSGVRRRCAARPYPRVSRLRC